MSAYSMKPTFVDYDGYQQWRAQWRTIYARLSTDIRRAKSVLRSCHNEEAAKLQKSLHYQRVMARKMLSLLEDAKERWTKTKALYKSLADQNAKFPLEISDCRYVDFHFNKISLDYPKMPMWTVKTKGQSFYVKNVTANVPWTTRENPNASSKGTIRLKNCSLMINADGEAMISA